MQVKTIKKIVTNKLEEWLESITDKELRNDLRNNLLLTGGSICSLLENKEVNDYDIYIQDIEVLERLSKYYVSIAPEMCILSGRHLMDYVDYIKERENIFSNNLSDIEELEGVFNAFDGHNINFRDYAAYTVALRTMHKNQVKIWCNIPGGMVMSDHVEKFYKTLNQEIPKYVPAFISPNAISLTDNIQIVTRFCGTPEEIHKTFDFIHATNYFTFKDGLVFNEKALLSIMSHQLYYQGSQFPLTSIIRVKKFLARGWNISAGEQLKMIFQVSKLDLENPDVLEEQLVGVDVAYFSTLVSILRGNKEKSFTAEYLNAVIDRIFNEYDSENEGRI